MKTPLRYTARYIVSKLGTEHPDEFEIVIPYRNMAALTEAQRERSREELNQLRQGIEQCGYTCTFYQEGGKPEYILNFKRKKEPRP